MAHCTTMYDRTMRDGVAAAGVEAQIIVSTSTTASGCDVKNRKRSAFFSSRSLASKGGPAHLGIFPSLLFKISPILWGDGHWPMMSLVYYWGAYTSRRHINPWKEVFKCSIDTLLRHLYVPHHNGAFLSWRLFGEWTTWNHLDSRSNMSA